MDYGGQPSHRAKGPASPATTHTPRSPAVNRSATHVSGTGSSLTLSSGASISYLSSYGCSGACKCMNNLVCTTTSTIFGMADHSSTPGNGAGRSYPPYGVSMLKIRTKRTSSPFTGTTAMTAFLSEPRGHQAIAAGLFRAAFGGRSVEITSIPARAMAYNAAIARRTPARTHSVICHL